MNKGTFNGDRTDSYGGDKNRRGSDKPNPFNMGIGVDRKYSDLSTEDSTGSTFRKYSDNRNGNVSYFL
jgi:hypothetical protein